MAGAKKGSNHSTVPMICRLWAAKWRQSQKVIAQCNSALRRHGLDPSATADGTGQPTGSSGRRDRQPARRAWVTQQARNLLMPAEGPPSTTTPIAPTGRRAGCASPERGVG